MTVSHVACDANFADMTQTIENGRPDLAHRFGVQIFRPFRGRRVTTPSGGKMDAAGRFTEVLSSDGSTAERMSTSGQTAKHDDEGEEHPWLAAAYPLSHFIGFRPRSHPHAEHFDRHDPRFCIWHYRVGMVLSFGLPVSGETGEVARYRDEYTGKVHVAEMYKDQIGAKLVNSLHSLIAAWVLIAVLSLLSRTPFFRAHDAPLLVGAFATEAVVTFFSYRVALAQPKNILVGNTICAIIGVALTRAFEPTSYRVSTIDGVSWAAAATTVSVAVFAMQLLGCIHPPGAAIALLANINSSEYRLGWYLVPVVIVSSLVIIAWALIINNLGGRRWPENWFYQNAFRDPPVIGPEKLPFANSPYSLPRRRPRPSPSFYRQSGAKTTSKQAQHIASQATRVGSVDAQHARKHSAQSHTKPAPEPASAPEPAAEPATEPTAEPVAEAAPLAAAANQDVPLAAADGDQPLATTPGGSGSRMIESVSRNNSKGSKRSKRSVVVHVNDRRGSGTDIPPVPAIQWRQ